jgi:hypothetical protein
MDRSAMAQATDQHRRSSGGSHRPAAITSLPESEGRPGLLDLPEMRFQEHYIWLIFVGSLDIMLTWVILRNGGEEVNPVARLVIDMWGLNGAIAFKFALMLFVIVSCEIIARVRPVTATLLIWFGVLVSAFPPVWSVVLLVYHHAVPV